MAESRLQSWLSRARRRKDTARRCNRNWGVLPPSVSNSHITRSHGRGVCCFAADTWLSLCRHSHAKAWICFHSAPGWNICHYSCGYVGKQTLYYPCSSQFLVLLSGAKYPHICFWTLHLLKVLFSNNLWGCFEVAVAPKPIRFVVRAVRNQETYK